MQNFVDGSHPIVADTELQKLFRGEPAVETGQVVGVIGILFSEVHISRLSVGQSLEYRRRAADVTEPGGYQSLIEGPFGIHQLLHVEAGTLFGHLRDALKGIADGGSEDPGDLASREIVGGPQQGAFLGTGYGVALFGAGLPASFGR